MYISYMYAFTVIFWLDDPIFMDCINEGTVVIIYTPRNEVRGGILESPCPSVCLSVDARG